VDEEYQDSTESLKETEIIHELRKNSSRMCYLKKWIDDGYLIKMDDGQIFSVNSPVQFILNESTTETTYIEEAGIHQCNNCGAYASSVSEIKHFESCQEGESKYWEDFYSKEE